MLTKQFRLSTTLLVVAFCAAYFNWQVLQSRSTALRNLISNHNAATRVAIATDDHNEQVCSVPLSLERTMVYLTLDISRQHLLIAIDSDGERVAELIIPKDALALKLTTNENSYEAAIFKAGSWVTVGRLPKLGCGGVAPFSGVAVLPNSGLKIIECSSKCRQTIQIL